MPAAPIVLVVGGICHDFFCYVDRFPRAGETVNGHDFRMGSGGKGASAAVMCSKLGAAVSMVGVVGAKDPFGDISIQSMRDAGVRTELITRTTAAMTATASITVDSNGENFIVTNLRANQHLLPARVHELEAKVARSAMILCQFEIPHKTNLAAFKLARKHKVTTFLNAAPARTELSLDDPLFSLTDVLCINQTECGALVGEELRGLAEFEAAIPKILASGPRIVIVTLGADGALVGSREENGKVRIAKVDAPKVDVVDTTGAGDCFCGAFAYFFLQSNGDFVLAAEKAAQIAALSVTKAGNQNSYPTVETLKALGIL
ncbi:Ribokinase [Aphelenchoides fujianensis]|nr:Ribokinase [Aphelenchoides fujianensis]